MAKRYIPISNDQMFKHVFGRNKELCRRLIELALEVPIEKVEFVAPQQESRDVGRSGGTYFDVLATTGDGELIDVEMQKNNERGLLQRARLYLGRLTKEAWSNYVEVHHDYRYDNMPRVAVIFICDYDSLGLGLRRYVGSVRYDGAEDCASDGAMSVLLSTKGASDGVAPELAAFLDYVADGIFAPGLSRFVDGVAQEVDAANDDAEFLEGLMDMDEKLWLSKEEGLKEGKAEGLKRGAEEQQQRIAALATRMISDGRQEELPSVLTDKNLLAEELQRYGIQ